MKTAKRSEFLEEGAMNRERNGKVLCWTLVCCTAASPLAGEPKNSKTLPPADAKQRVLNLEREWVDAEIKHDAATLPRILDDKFVATFVPRNRTIKKLSSSR